MNLNNKVQHLGTEYIPTPESNALSEEEKKQVAYTLYSRFIRHGSLPAWTSPLATDIQKNIISGVTQVLECLELNGYRIEHEKFSSRPTSKSA